MAKFSSENLPSFSTIISTLGTVTATAFLLRTIVSDLVPASLSISFKKLSGHLSSTFTVVVEEFDGLTPNHLFRAANTYLSTKISASTRRVKANKVEKDDGIIVTVDKNQEIVDVYGGVKLVWVLCSVPLNETNADRNSNAKTELKFFELSFNKKHKDFVLKTYLPHTLAKSKEIEEHNKAVRLHTVDYSGTDYWSSVVLNHPATFDTMAMEREKKREIVDDLDTFLSRREYYRRVGNIRKKSCSSWYPQIYMRNISLKSKAWKRGYLFYGLPGTGKSSLVAAIANYLRFDVYDLDLKEVQCNSDLRRLLIGSGNRSILVIEDIDCNVGLLNRDGEPNNRADEDDKITLSGLLNFIDGLWSSCGDEKIIIFTTNHKDRLDQALLRPGRMDMHIHMSYLTFDGFKILAYNYLRIESNRLFGSVEDLLTKVNVTPAEIAGELMKIENTDISLQNIIEFLMEKRKLAMIEEQAEGRS